MDDIFNNLQHEDLRDMGISIGPRARIWAAIQNYRSNNKPQILNKQNSQHPAESSLEERVDQDKWNPVLSILNTTVKFGLEVIKNI